MIGNKTQKNYYDSKLKIVRDYNIQRVCHHNLPDHMNLNDQSSTISINADEIMDTRYQSSTNQTSDENISLNISRST